MNKQKKDHYGEIVTLLLRSKRLSDTQVRYAERVRSKLSTATPLLNVLKDLGYVDDEMVREVMLHSPSSLRIGELLVELGHLGEDELQAAFNIKEEKEKELKLGEVLVKYNFIEESLFNRILSIQLGFPLIEVDLAMVDQERLRKLPLKLAIEHGFLPIRSDDDRQLVAFSDPLDEKSLAVAGRCFGAKIGVGIAGKSAMRETLNLLEARQSGRKIDVDGTSVVGIVNSIIVEALRAGASDIHIEPLTDRIQVRFRIDGVLTHYRDYPRDILASLNSRIKILCEADIAERRRHQGGRILFDYDEGKVDIRVSIYVTVHGEKVVFRLLKQKKELLEVNSLGMAPKMLRSFLEDAVYQPSGVLLVTGPTGSGKTSTVYSCIQHIKNPQISIVTAEEPVEYVMDGVAQCSIDPQINMTFEETLRHIVRQDPDVIVIGEIRDRASAEMAVQSALTGHKVLTTFHTEDSIGGLIRLLNMDIAPFLVSSTVLSVLAQRLLRRVCPACAVEVRITPQQLHRLGCSAEDLRGASFRKGRGCSECRQTGYAGRIGIFELLVLDERVRDAILEQRTSYEIRQISVEHSGLITLLEDGLVKAAAGITSIDELLRCLPKLSPPRPLAEIRRLAGE